MDIEKIVVVGAGTMGSGIAQTAAASGCDVALADVDQQRAIAAVDLIRNRLENRVTTGKFPQRENSSCFPASPQYPAWKGAAMQI